MLSSQSFSRLKSRLMSVYLHYIFRTNLSACQFGETRESIDYHSVPMSSTSLVVYGTPKYHPGYLTICVDDTVQEVSL